MPSVPIIALAAAVLLLSPCAASAQAWPSRPVTMMVPFPAGGTADLLARGTAQALSDALGQPFRDGEAQKELEMGDVFRFAPAARAASGHAVTAPPSPRLRRKLDDPWNIQHRARTSFAA